MLLFGYVGLATMGAGLAAPVYMFVQGSWDSQPALFCFASACAGFLVYTHRGNIQRMRQGIEHCMFAHALLRKKR